MKYRKKPIEIEAEQWFPGVKLSFQDVDIRESPFLNGAFILTPEGQHVIQPGYWVIRGIAGEYYGCAPEIFAQTYEAV